ncbi:MAG: hypothetical protein M3094_08725 [Actinomycetia bacterium]|nr:hypothetical protein [Actinomycetes bacterium]
MPVERITVVGVSDRGDDVVVWGLSSHTPDDSPPTGFIFQTKGPGADVRLAERASSLVSGSEVDIEYTQIVGGWNQAAGLTTPS